MLAIYFLIGFPLIAIFFFLDQSNIPIIFINKEIKLQYLNIELCDFDIELCDFDFHEWYTTMFEYFTCDLAWVVNDLWNSACQRLFKFQHVLFAWHVSWVGTRELVSREILIFTKSSPNSYTQPLH